VLELEDEPVTNIPSREGSFWPLKPKDIESEELTARYTPSPEPEPEPEPDPRIVQLKKWYDRGFIDKEEFAKRAGAIHKELRKPDPTEGYDIIEDEETIANRKAIEEQEEEANNRMRNLIIANAILRRY